MQFHNNCVGWPRHDVYAEGGLRDLIDEAHEVTRSTFLKHVDREDLKNLELELGYSLHPSQGLTMAGDYHVRYYRSKLHGERVYFFTHSAIEYVFK